jgi:uncharacterized surface protein with fasciclin (FAS1) repeats
MKKAIMKNLGSLLVLTALIVLAAGTGDSGSGGGSSSSGGNTHADALLLERQADAERVSKEYILRFLKHPDDATFGFWDVPEIRWNKEQDVFVVSSKVLAKNDFGGELTYRWTTIVMLEDNVWQLVSCVIDDTVVYDSPELWARLEKRAAPPQKPAPSPKPAPAPAPVPDKEKSIMGRANEWKNMSTFCKLIEAAGLADTLQGNGPFTVFVPLNDAFVNMGNATLDDLLKPENKEKLVALMKQHIVAGKMMYADIAAVATLKTLNGEGIKVTGNSSNVTLDQTISIISRNIECKNGVIHVIDHVLVPPGAVLAPKPTLTP